MKLEEECNADRTSSNARQAGARGGSRQISENGRVGVRCRGSSDEAVGLNGSGHELCNGARPQFRHF
jgi:hypothetical protein